jgi:hypothetical protein
MRLTIELDALAQPIMGWLKRTGEPKQEFVGMLELISLLEQLRDRSGPSVR